MLLHLTRYRQRTRPIAARAFGLNIASVKSALLKHGVSGKAPTRSLSHPDDYQSFNPPLSSRANEGGPGQTVHNEEHTPLQDPPHSKPTNSGLRKVRRPEKLVTKSKESHRGFVIEGSSNHHDLQSFVGYTERVGLDRSSTVYVGTRYEYTVAEALRAFRFHLTRTGRTSDRGIDLVGLWKLPDAPGQIPVVLQCKAEKPKPSFVRELEGALVGAPAGWHGDGVMALLVAAGSATKGVREAVIRSRLPMGFLNISKDGHVKQFLWNHSAAEKGLEGVGVSLRHRSFACNNQSAKEDDEHLTLTWKGRPWLSS